MAPEWALSGQSVLHSRSNYFISSSLNSFRAPHSTEGYTIFLEFPFLLFFPPFSSFLALSVVVRKRFERKETERCTLTWIQAKAYICSSVAV